MLKSVYIKSSVFTFVVFVLFINEFVAQTDRVLLEDIKKLTLRQEKYIISRNSNSTPQLLCVNSTHCGDFGPELVYCYNIGYNKIHAKWFCTAQMNKNYNFGKIEVVCEGYDYPADPYVLNGSCMLKYQLSYVVPVCESGTAANSFITFLFEKLFLEIYIIQLLISALFRFRFIPFYFICLSVFIILARMLSKKNSYKPVKCGIQKKYGLSSWSNRWLRSLISYLFPNKESNSGKHEEFVHSSISLSNFSKANLSTDYQRIVDSIWNSSADEFPLDKKCVEEHGMVIYRRDLLKLKTGDWINDEIINFFMALIVDRSEKIKILPKIIR